MCPPAHLVAKAVFPTLDVLSDLSLLYTWGTTCGHEPRAAFGLFWLLLHNGLDARNVHRESSAPQPWWQYVVHVCGLGIVSHVATIFSRLLRGELTAGQLDDETRQLTRMKLVEVTYETAPQFILQLFAGVSDGHLALAGITWANWNVARCGGSTAGNGHAGAAPVCLGGLVSCKTQLLATMALGSANIAAFFLAYEREESWKPIQKRVSWLSCKWLHPAAPTLLLFRLAEFGFRTMTLAFMFLAIAHTRMWYGMLGPHFLVGAAFVPAIAVLLEIFFISSSCCGCCHPAAVMSRSIRRMSTTAGHQRTKQARFTMAILFWIGPGLIGECRSLSEFADSQQQQALPVDEEPDCTCAEKRRSEPHLILGIKTFLSLRLFAGLVPIGYMCFFVNFLTSDDPFTRSKLLRLYLATGIIMLGAAYLWHKAQRAIVQGRGYVFSAGPTLPQQKTRRSVLTLASAYICLKCVLAATLIVYSIWWGVSYPNAVLGENAAIDRVEVCQQSQCTELT